MSLTKTLLRLATAGLTLGVLLVGGQTPSASAAATCVLGTPTVTPSNVFSIGTSGLLTATVTVTATNCPSAAAKTVHMWWVMEGPGDIGDPGWPQLTATNVGNNATFKATLRVEVGNALAGDRPTALWGESKKLKTAPTLQLRRTARVTTNATPEPWIKGETFTVKGTVQRADWNYGIYRAYGDHLMDLQFRTPTSPWATIKQVYSNWDGALRTTVKANLAGCYRYISKQTSTASAANSIGDCVTVSAAARTVCTGVPGCVITAYSDVDGDRKADQIGLVTRDTSIVVRVKTATRTMQTTSRNTGWAFLDSLQAAAPIDGRRGNEIVIGDVTGANTYWYRIVTYRSGTLVTLKPPTAATVPSRWGTESSNSAYAGFSRSVTRTGVVSVTDKYALHNNSGNGYTGKTTVYRWKSDKWIKYSRTTVHYTSYRKASVIAGWHIKGLPVWPT